MMNRKVILVIDDDEDNRLLAQQSDLLGKRVLTNTCENGWDAVLENSSLLYAVLIDDKDYQRGLAIAILAIKAGAFYIGVVSETLPEVLDRTSFSVNGILVSLNSGDGLFLPDGRRNWVRLLRSLTSEGPIIISVPVS